MLHSELTADVTEHQSCHSDFMSPRFCEFRLIVQVYLKQRVAPGVFSQTIRHQKTTARPTSVQSLIWAETLQRCLQWFICSPNCCRQALRFSPPLHQEERSPELQFADWWFTVWLSFCTALLQREPFSLGVFSGIKLSSQWKNVMAPCTVWAQWFHHKKPWLDWGTACLWSSSSTPYLTQHFS